MEDGLAKTKAKNIEMDPGKTMQLDPGQGVVPTQMEAL